jgi:hypothetical protein
MSRSSEEKETVVMCKMRLSLVIAMSFIGLCASITYADEDESKTLGAVAKLMPTTKVTLQQGLTAAEQKGRPISGKFEVDEGNSTSPFIPHRGQSIQRIWSTTTRGS